MTPPISNAFRIALTSSPTLCQREHPLDALDRVDARRNSASAPWARTPSRRAANGVSSAADDGQQEQRRQQQQRLPRQRSTKSCPWHRYRRRRRGRSVRPCRMMPAACCDNQPPSTQKPPTRRGHDEESHQFARLRNLPFLARLLEASCRCWFCSFEIAVFSQGRSPPCRQLLPPWHRRGISRQEYRGPGNSASSICARAPCIVPDEWQAAKALRSEAGLVQAVHATAA